MSYSGSLKQQTPSEDYSLRERFAECCTQQRVGWKPHVPPLGTGESILVSLKANKVPLPSSYCVLIAHLSNFGNNSPVFKRRPEPLGFVAPTPLLHMLQPVKQRL